MMYVNCSSSRLRPSIANDSCHGGFEAGWEAGLGYTNAGQNNKKRKCNKASVLLNAQRIFCESRKLCTNEHGWKTVELT